jgi:hypothetical protein
VTVPVGAPKPGVAVLTVTVKVTELPEREGLLDEVSLVEVPAFLTTCLRVEDVLPLNLLSPL